VDESDLISVVSLTFDEPMRNFSNVRAARTRRDAYSADHDLAAEKPFTASHRKENDLPRTL